MVNYIRAYAIAPLPPPTLGENLLLTPPELGVQGAFAAIGSNICVSPIYKQKGLK